MSIAKDFIKFLDEAEDKADNKPEASKKYTITFSNKKPDVSVDTLDDALETVKGVAKNTNVVVKVTKTDKKVAFGNKNIAMAVLMSLKNKEKK